MNRMKFVFLALTALILSGCVSTEPYNEDPNAIAKGVTIESKEQFYAWGSTTKYGLKDKAGGSYYVISALDTYNIGDCVTLWQSRKRLNNFQYPRITPSQSNCKVATKQQDIGDNFLYDYKNNIEFREIYNFLLDAWMGATPDELMSRWGVPDKQSSANGSSYIAYIHKSYDYYGNPLTCETTFTVKNNVLTNYSWRGNDCVEFIHKAG